ncbi:hypothetical protein ACFVWN_01300 [Nocardiopsis flavescens]|uniref:putative phage holin n=1 Tax=Nocardiopsis flavescens TaxID=758803 RepID=UPI003660066C
MSTVIVIGNLLLGGTAALLWAFVIAYAFFTRWEATEAGRALLAISLITALILTLGCTRLIVGPSHVLDVARTALYLAALLTLCRLFWIFLRTQFSVRKTSDPKE